jgi:flagellar biosynthetic protein FliP
MPQKVVRQAAAVLGLCLLALPVQAQDVVLNLADGASLSGMSIRLFLLVGLISLAPGLLIMATCFPFIVTVLSILRQAIGLQQSPPNMLIVSLALVLTYYVMDPVFSEAWSTGLEPLLEERMDTPEALSNVIEPFRAFMGSRVDPDTYARLAELRAESSGFDPTSDLKPLSILVPAFLLSEIATAFEIGFLIFLPFLVIDLVVAAVLMSMGMMMVPPAIVSLPFKLAFFAVADGFTLVSEALVRGYF